MNLERKFMTIITKKRRRQEIFSSNELYIYEQNHNTTGNSQYFELYIKEIEKILTKEDLLRAMKITKSNMHAARHLHVSYTHYKKYAKLYKNDEGSTL